MIFYILHVAKITTNTGNTWSSWSFNRSWNSVAYIRTIHNNMISLSLDPDTSHSLLTSHSILENIYVQININNH